MWSRNSSSKIRKCDCLFYPPIVLSYYVKKKYEIDADIKPNNSAISQRWDAFAQQAAAFVNNNTDVIVLTMFSDIKEVSVYTVYYMVANGLYKVEQTFTDGIEAAFGNMLAKKRIEYCKKISGLLNIWFYICSILVYMWCSVNCSFCRSLYIGNK